MIARPIGRRAFRISNPALWRIAAALLLWLVPSQRGMAQEDRSNEPVESPGLSIEASAGWDGVVDRRVAVPLSFLIRNRTDRIIEGELTLTDRFRRHEANLGTIVLTPGTARRVAAIRAMTDWNECIATLSHEGKVLWRRELPLGDFLMPQQFRYALFVDPSGRGFLPPNAEPALSEEDAPAWYDQRIAIAGKEGWKVRFLSAKPWQLPGHDGALEFVQGVIFPESADETALNAAQWQALAEWISRGGALFVHHESPKIVERLIEAAPLDVQPAVTSEPFAIRRLGLGAIHEFETPLFSREGIATRKEIERVIALFPRNAASPLLASLFLSGRRDGRAESNRILMVCLFLFYGFFIGLVSLALFRLNPRGIGTYAVIVVAGTSLLAGLLGAYIRFSSGDLRWVTVTQVGAGGASQIGRIDVQSAGGRASQVAITGERADLQLSALDRHYNPWNWQPQMAASYTWQPSLVAEADSYRIEIPMTPWGSRSLNAAAFTRGLEPLDFELAFQTSPVAQAPAKGKPPEIRPAGKFSVKVVNHLPFTLSDCRLIVGTANLSAPGAGAPTSESGVPVLSKRPSGMMFVNSRAAGPTPDVYVVKPLADISAGATREESFTAGFVPIDPNNWQQRLHYRHAVCAIPRITRLGEATAWIVGRLESSPILKIDPQSDFSPRDEVHLYVQEIRPEQMRESVLMRGE